ncbi:FkbM family methyltransferase [Microvirga terricola]|uniref:FkbM family methyltransferase n=1 Tax=Microvirga terricola TaxID=2719797 RepID=A0ABX0VBQ4_9HYPH|nr:FkbM family methyltransferase [Microvirga terricola]NIX77128.1 FkbM family methyltransferase [Microvirga terricola]
MVSMNSGSLKRMSARVQSVAHKLRWGIRSVGIAETIHGSARLMKLRLQHPKRSEVSLRSGPVLEFDYPSQSPPVLVMFGDFIDPEFSFLRQVSRPDWVVVDVGAAIGQFTIFAATLPCAVVHAYEPSGANIATLKRNIERNHVAGKVTVNQMALSNEDGSAVFETAEQTWMSQLSSAGSAGGEIVPVRTLTGELERSGISHLSVLKINVAGFEPKVLEGALPFLAEGRVDILVLLLGLPSLQWYERIASSGYRFFYYHPLEKKLYEIKSFDERSVLYHRPWPARHIIAIHSSAIAACITSGVEICCPLPTQNV